MKLIKFEDFQIKLADEAFLVRPIRRLWNQDRSAQKEQFWRQMSYLYFMVSPSSNYSYILDMDERAAEIIKQEGLPEDFKPSPLLKEAMDIYKKLTITPSQKLLESSLVAADTVSKFLSDPTILEKRDDKKRPIYRWKLRDELLDYNIILMQNNDTGQLDIISLSAFDCNTEIPFGKGRHNLLGAYKTDVQPPSYLQFRF